MSLLSRIGAHNGRLLFTVRPSLMSSSKVLKSTGTAQQQMDEFWQKNRELNRPMSPHITVYKLVDVTSGLSITHRATGIMLAAATVGFAFGSVLMPQNLDTVILSFQSLNETMLGSLLLLDAKFFLVWPIIFHTLNGMRHLWWDTGKGFELETLRKSGMGVLIASIALSVLIVLCCRKKQT